MQASSPSLHKESTDSDDTSICFIHRDIEGPQLPTEKYLFVEEPSNDFFCPVITNLLIQPHLTACCGMHLSQVAATRIQAEGGACPLCNTPHLNTVLNKHFQRQVNALRVLCHHEDRGCGWQGELSDLNRHVNSCPMKEAPLMTDLLKLPVYGQPSRRQDLALEKQQVGKREIQKH